MNVATPFLVSGASKVNSRLYTPTSKPTITLRRHPSCTILKLPVFSPASTLIGQAVTPVGLWIAVVNSLTLYIVFS